MLVIPCPHCGPRDEAEFTYGGPVRAACPLTGDGLYSMPNPSGPLREWWYHSSGCETWIEVTRNTRTHAILGSGASGATP